MAVLTLDEYVNQNKKKKGIQNAITLEEYAEKKGIRSLGKGEDDIAPVRESNSGRTMGVKRNEGTVGLAGKGEIPKRTWFTSGAFEDGYQFGDFAKTILGTKRDVEENLATGILGMGEKVVDAGAYVAGGVGGLFGADKFENKVQDFIAKDLYDEEALAKKMGGVNASTRALSKLLGVDGESDSMLGEKTDSLTQSAGQLGATIGLQFVGVPWWVTTGVTSFGGEVETAFNEDATYGEAGLSAAITAGADILTEKLFGGSGLGETGLLTIKPLTEKIASKALRTLAKYGVDVAGEGVEEVVASVFSKLGTSLYKEENVTELLASEEALDEYLESFIGGAVLGGGMNAGKVVSSLKTGRDYDTGLTDNEQKVVSKEVENRVTEQEKDGKKLTAKEKATIEEQVKNDLQKGYISIDTIESVLGGETYESYKSITERESALKTEIEALQNDPRPAMKKRLQEAQAELSKIEKGTEKTQLKDQLSLEVKELTKNDYLSESYNERARRSQKFQIDSTKYDTKQQEVIKKAVESGILNNTNRTHEFVDLLAKLSADKGVSFDFTNNENLKQSGFAIEGKTVNGLVKGNDIILNIDSSKALNTVVGHEITHVLEGTELYTELQNAVKEYAITKGEYDVRYKALEGLYKGVEGANIDNELTADLVGEYLFTDSDFVNKLSTEKPNIFKKIYEEIKYLVKVATAGSKEARELEKVKKAFDKAYQDITSNTKNSDIMFSLSGVENGIEVYETSEEIKSLSYKERKQMLLDKMKNDFAGRTAKFTKNGEVYYAQYDESGVNKGVYGDNKSSNKGYKAKINIGADGNYIELAENALYQSSKPETGKENRFHKNAKSWDYFVKTVKSDGKYFDVLINVKDTGNDQYVYDITLKETDSLPDSQGSYDGSLSASNKSIPQNTENATRFSLSVDSEGRTLSKEQQEYFKNAKTRNEQGSLKPYYHGTGRADRVGNVFRPDRATSGPMAFFTDNKEIADNYAKDKQDTSIAYDEMYDSYYTQFRIEVNGKNLSVVEAWNKLPASKKTEIKSKAQHVTMDDDFENVIYDEKQNRGLGGFDNYRINEHKGNYLSALVGEWLEDGNIYGEEEKFLEVLSLVGLDNVQYMNPDARNEKTYQVYLNVTKPFLTTDISNEMLQAFKDAANKVDYAPGNAADMWDKRNIEPMAWIDNLERDIANGTTHAWTSIPDFITDTLKEHDYDGIFDVGGKGGGAGHQVVIPFYSEQIKNIDNMNPTTDSDIRYYLSTGKGKTHGNYNVYGKDIRLDTPTTQEATEITPTTQNDTLYAPMVEDIAPTRVYAVTEPTPMEDVKTEKVKSEAPEMAKVTTNPEATKQRKWVETSTESEVVNGIIAAKDLDQRLTVYQPISNQKTLGNANVRLKNLGYDSSVDYFNSQFTNKRVTLDDIALGERLIQEAIKKGDTQTAGELIQNVAILGTELGQKVQALSIIKRLTPEGQLGMLQKVVARGKAKGDKAFEGVEITQEMIDMILKVYGKDGTYDQKKLDEAVEGVKQKIAEQMEVTTMDKVNAWRYLSMLGNPKTHIRNLVSNIAMKGTLEVKNALARTMEDTVPIKNKTKTWVRATDEVKEFAKQITLEMKDIISDDNKYSEEASIKAKREIFKNKILNSVYEFNSDLLSKEDWWFSKPAFNKAFSEYLTANGIKTSEDIAKNTETVEKAKLYATEQAQIATFRQYSWLANKIRDIESKNTATDIVVGSILPFKKTPINIAKAGLNYSPLGFAKSLTYDAAQVKKGNMEASTMIDHLAQNTTGTALTLIGYMLASAGFLNGSGDDDKEGKYDYQLGKQSYSVNIGNSTYSLSWLSPVAMPLFVGANAYEQLVEGEEWNGDVVVETLAQTLDPLSEMSFLSSLDSVLSSYDSGIQKFAGIGEAMAQNYATQFIPTLSSQVATVLDDKKRTTKVAGDSDFKMVDETINKLIYKIPFLRKTLEPTTDIWGNEVKQKEDIFARAVETFIAPYSRKESIATGIDAELKELYGETGDNGLIPSIPYNYVNYKGEKYEMSAKEYTDFKKTYGQIANGLLEELFKSTTYQGATSEDRAEMVNKVYDYARDEAKKEYLAKEGVEYTNATEDNVPYYKENNIKGAIENDITLEEFSLYNDNPDKYNFLQSNNVSYEEYTSSKEIKEAYDWAYKNPEKYVVSKAAASDLTTYRSYVKEINALESDKDDSGKTINGSRKEKVLSYINNLDADYGEKIILFKSAYNADDTYNEDIIDYLNNREDISYSDVETILKELGFTVDADGTVSW